MSKFNDFVRRTFTQHVLKLLSDDKEGHGYQVTSLVVEDSRTLIVFESDNMIVTPYNRSDGQSSYYGTRRVVVTIQSEYEPHRMDTGA